MQQGCTLAQATITPFPTWLTSVNRAYLQPLIQSYQISEGVKRLSWTHPVQVEA